MGEEDRTAGEGRGLRDRARSLLGAVRRPQARGSKATTGVSRSGSVSGPRSSRPASSTRPRKRTPQANGSRKRGWISSSATPPPTRRARRSSPRSREAGVPVVVLNLQPSSSLDYANTDTGEWLANCSACCVPEISNAFERAAIPFNVVSGTLHEDEHAWAEIEEWCHAATAVGTLRGSRFGFLGHTYPGMLDMYSDFTMHQAQLGLHVEVLEMDDLHDRVEDVSEEAIAAKLEETRETFEVDESVNEEDLEWSARVVCRPRPSRRRLRPRRPRLLLQGHQRQRLRAARRRSHTRQLPAHGARHPGLRGG